MVRLLRVGYTSGLPRTSIWLANQVLAHPRIYRGVLPVGLTIGAWGMCDSHPIIAGAGTFAVSELMVNRVVNWSTALAAKRVFNYLNVSADVFNDPAYQDPLRNFLRNLRRDKVLVWPQFDDKLNCRLAGNRELETRYLNMQDILPRKGQEVPSDVDQPAPPPNKSAGETCSGQQIIDGLTSSSLSERKEAALEIFMGILRPEEFFQITSAQLLRMLQPYLAFSAPNPEIPCSQIPFVLLEKYLNDFRGTPAVRPVFAPNYRGRGEMMQLRGLIERCGDIINAHKFEETISIRRDRLCQLANDLGTLGRYDLTPKISVQLTAEQLAGMKAAIERAMDINSGIRAFLKMILDELEKMIPQGAGASPVADKAPAPAPTQRTSGKRT